MGPVLVASQPPTPTRRVRYHAHVTPGASLFLIALFVLLPVVLILEGKRQESIHGKGTGRRMTQVAVLEMQRHLQPDRKVEIVLERREDVAGDEEGDGPPRPRVP